MLTNFLSRGTLALLLGTALCAACGSSTDADPYNGVVFSTDSTVYAFDTKFLASTDKNVCNRPYMNPPGTYPCYPIQQGYANGKPLQFYQLMPTLYASATANPQPPKVSAIYTSDLPNPLPASVADKKQDRTGGSHADIFFNSCAPDANYDPRTDPYPKLQQGPVFDSLPLALTYNTSYGAIVWPVVATYGVTGLSGNVCNDIKDSRSIGGTGAPGAFGSMRSDLPTSYQMWPVIDSTSPLIPFDTSLSTTASPFSASLGWYKGLQLRYLNGGRIPTKIVQDPAFPNDTNKTMTSLVVMDAAIVDPSSSGYSAVTADKAVVFPAAPGEDAWSPIVRLHDVRLPSGKSLGYYNGICQVGQTGCPATYIDAAKMMATTSYNTIFVVAPPQQ